MKIWANDRLAARGADGPIAFCFVGNQCPAASFAGLRRGRTFIDHFLNACALQQSVGARKTMPTP